MFAILLSERMDPFYTNAGSFPTVVFTFLLLVCALYWLIAVLGLVDIEFLDFDMSGVDTDIDAGSGSEGFTGDVLAGLMLKFGLYGVPVTIIVSFIALIGWLASYFIVHFTFGIVPDGLLRYLAGLPVLAVSFFVAVMITAQLIKPLRKLFRHMGQHTDKKVLGQTVVVRTSRVDSTFGEGMLDDGGAGLILKIRATGEQRFKKGERVVLFEYNPQENTYRVISEQEFNG